MGVVGRSGTSIQLTLGIGLRQIPYDSQTRCSQGCPTNTFVIDKESRWSFCSDIFKSPSLQKCMSLGLEILRECSPLSTCHMSCVMCHMSHVKYHRWYLFLFFQRGEANQWRVCYQRGLTRLVLLINMWIVSDSPGLKDFLAMSAVAMWECLHTRSRGQQARLLGWGLDLQHCRLQQINP